MHDSDGGPSDGRPAWFTALRRASTAINRISAALAAAILVGMVTIILVEIVFRFFSRSTHMADALVSYGLAASTFLSIGWALESDSMIRVTLVRRRVGRKTLGVLDFFAIVSTLFISSLLVVFGYFSMVRNYLGGRMSEHYFQIPLWIPDAIFIVGFVAMIIQLGVRLIGLLLEGPSRETDFRI